MKKPNQEQNQIILDVIDKIAPRYSFGYYEVDDIKQEAYLLSVEAFQKYDESRPLENFISKHLSNRLKTLRRDKYQRPGSSDESKKMLMDLSEYTILPGLHPSYSPEIEERLSTKEALEFVMENLPPSLRNDFMRLANGVTIQSYKKAALFDRIKEILDEDW